MSANVGYIVLPGETLTHAKEMTIDNKKIVLGDGLRFLKNSWKMFLFTFLSLRCNIVSQGEQSQIPVVTKGGMLCKRKPNIFYVDSYQKRYIPAKNDSVVGVVQTKTMDFFWVDINASEPAGK